MTSEPLPLITVYLAIHVLEPLWRYYRNLPYTVYYIVASLILPTFTSMTIHTFALMYIYERWRRW